MKQIIMTNRSHRCIHLDTLWQKSPKKKNTVIHKGNMFCISNSIKFDRFYEQNEKTMKVIACVLSKCSEKPGEFLYLFEFRVFLLLYKYFIFCWKKKKEKQPQKLFNLEVGACNFTVALIIIYDTNTLPP